MTRSSHCTPAAGRGQSGHNRRRPALLNARRTFFPILQRLVEDVILVRDDEIRAAMKFLLTRMKIVVEPSGAVAAAALLSGKLPKNLNWAAVILSGGNVDVEQLATL